MSAECSCDTSKVFPFGLDNKLEVKMKEEGEREEKGGRRYKSRNEGREEGDEMGRHTVLDRGFHQCSPRR